ncbi:MAG: McrB family protein [Acidimicrobiales bacterium]
MNDAFVIRVNIHRQLWDGTVCENPLQHHDCLQPETFKADYCAHGIARCFFVNLFHAQSPSMRLPKGQEAHRAVFEHRNPSAGDIAFFWGSYGDRANNFVVGLWEVSAFDDSDPKDFVIRGKPGTAVRLPARTVPYDVLSKRVARSVGGDAVRFLPAQSISIVVSHLLQAAEDDYNRLFAAGRNTDDARAAKASLSGLAAGLPEVAQGHLTHRIVIPPGLARPPPGLAQPPLAPSRAPAPGAQASPPSPARIPARTRLPVAASSGRAVDSFPQQLVQDYTVALRVSPLVLLAGPSGSGKTFLTRAFAESVGAAYCLVAVRPDWRANEDLLGYLQPFGADFVAGAFTLHVAAAAAEHDAAKREGRPARPYHLCLDEMNLARPEHYLAEVLSKMELEEPDRVLRLYEAPSDQGFPREVRLPPNLSIVGTVNNDDTTYPFSPKVLDRAVYLICDHIDLKKFFAARSGAVDDFVAPIVLELDGILRQAGIRIGYRVAGKVADWVTLAVGQGVAELDALDGAVRHLVLPRMRLLRSEPAHAEALSQLRSYLVGLGPPDTDAMARSTEFLDALESTLRRREVAFGQLET